MENYTPILKEPIIIKNCSTPFFLKGLRTTIESSKNWNFLFPGNKDFNDKFAKLDIDNSSKESSFLSGLTVSLLINIFENGGNKYFYPKVLSCGASIKTSNTYQNIHTDNTLPQDPLTSKPVLKILGILNSDWDASFGGNFIWDDKDYPLSLGDFIIFDAKIPHGNSKILTTKKRIALDFTVPAKV